MPINIYKGEAYMNSEKNWFRILFRSKPWLMGKNIIL